MPAKSPAAALMLDPAGLDADLDADLDAGPLARGASVRSIVEALEDDIVLGHLHPRERLIEDQLMVRFEAKRHVVRQALSDLDRMGLLERHPNRGAAVTDRGPQEVEHIYEMREVVESAAIRRMPLPLDAAALAALSEIQRRHDDVAAAADLRAIFRVNIEFHRAVFANCGNPHLAAATEQYGQKAHGIRSFAVARMNYAEAAAKDHWKIIRALKAGDRDKLLSVSLNHIRTSKVAYIEAYRARFGES